MQRASGSRSNPAPLVDLARHCVIPDDIAATLYYKLIAPALPGMGLTFDRWQEDIWYAALGLRDDGSLACDVMGVTLTIARQAGKALDVTTPMLTANRGWSTMGELRPGDSVFGSNGAPTKVLATHPVRHDRECFRVTTTDGREVIADAEHLWTVTDMRAHKSKGSSKSGGVTRWHETKTMTTRELLDAGLRRSVRANGRNEWRFQLPRQGAVRGTVADLPVDPYILGAWLGDGCGVDGRFSVHVDDMPHLIAQIEAGGYSATVRQDRTCMEVRASAPVGGRRQNDSLACHLRHLGMIGNKHVPDSYLAASAEQREALLQGLMDTDGCIATNGKAEFCSTEKRLAEAVLYLARSLGWRATIKESDAKLYGRVVSRRWRVCFMPKAYDEFTPFRLPRKVARIATTPDTHGRHTVSICGIEPVESRPVRCITVDANDSLYLAGRDLIVTHNTWGIMVGLIAICLSRPGTLVIWSSHHDRTSSETLTKIAGIVEKPAIRPKMRVQHPVVFTDDNRGVHFDNGSRILFGARSAGFGRGFSEVDIQVYDECQNLKESALTDMLAAMNVSDIGLAFFMGTPPRPQEVALGVNEAFKRRRDRALEPNKRRPFKGVFVEFSPESPQDVVADIDAPGFWDKLTEANPSYGFRVGKSAIERLVENMAPEDVLREVFGIWDKTNETVAVVPTERWNTIAVDLDALPDVASFGINATRSGWYWITACWCEGESAHVEIAIGTQSEVEAMGFISRHATKRTPIKHDSTGAAKALGEKLKQRNFRASAFTQNEAGAGNVLWLSMAEQGRLSHGGQPDLNLAVRGSRRQDRSSGGWMLVPRSNSFDIGPAIAMSAAVYAAMTARRPSGNSRAVAGRTRRQSSDRKAGVS